MRKQNSKNNPYLLVMLLGILMPGSIFAQVADSLLIRCATYEREVIKSQDNPGLQRDRIQTENAIQEYLKSNPSGMRRNAAETVIRIPVVVHIVHNRRDGVIGGVDNPNITDEQIRSQIAVLNEDYRKKENTKGFNTNPVGVDTGIEFYLAAFDDFGKSTTGITRTAYFGRDGFNPKTEDQLLSEIVYWPSDKYLNIWVCRLIGGNLGSAQFPSVEGVEGLDNQNLNYAKTDGIIIDFRYFGRNSAANSSKIYNLGRTTTHEVGHWLGLIHTWGDAFCGNDFCDDTPTAESANETTVCVDKFSNCSGFRTRNMIENYMDYSPDSCMNIFTADQLKRMQAVLALSPRRIRLLESEQSGRLEQAGSLLVDVFPNPLKTDLNANVRFDGFQNFTVAIYDQRSNLLETIGFSEVWSRRVTLDVSRFSAGLYFLRVTTNKETVTKRFVIK